MYTVLYGKRIINAHWNGNVSYTHIPLFKRELLKHEKFLFSHLYLSIFFSFFLSLFFVQSFYDRFYDLWFLRFLTSIALLLYRFFLERRRNRNVAWLCLLARLLTLLVDDCLFSRWRTLPRLLSYRLVLFPFLSFYRGRGRGRRRWRRRRRRDNRGLIEYRGRDIGHVIVSASLLLIVFSLLPLPFFHSSRIFSLLLNNL